MVIRAIHWIYYSLWHKVAALICSRHGKGPFDWMKIVRCLFGGLIVGWLGWRVAIDLGLEQYIHTPAPVLYVRRCTCNGFIQKYDSRNAMKCVWRRRKLWKNIVMLFVLSLHTEFESIYPYRYFYLRPAPAIEIARRSHRWNILPSSWHAHAYIQRHAR